MKQHTILIVDDDINIGNMLNEALEKASYRVLRAYSGTEALMVLEREKPDLVLLDLMLPGLSGEEVLSKLEGTLTIVMSAKTDIENKVKLLYGGASDYVTKPFVISEMMARIAALLRLSQIKEKEEDEPETEKGVLKSGNLIFDPNLLTVSHEDKEVTLTRTEAAILKLLMTNAGRPIGRSTILDEISEDTPDCTERSLKQHVSNIRKKLESISGIDHIDTIYGIGFRFKDQ
ncbi:MAG: response regulator transcription factor [Lachnospiraceae bacterium]|nr:response regulator transcription factor [Lachnospiraceae bacterium]